MKNITPQSLWRWFPFARYLSLYSSTGINAASFTNKRSIPHRTPIQSPIDVLQKAWAGAGAGAVGVRVCFLKQTVEQCKPTLTTTVTFAIAIAVVAVAVVLPASTAVYVWLTAKHVIL